ncbi:flagellar basal-body MS-ring/collar protein FliF [Clostridium aestuarii]|uniref:Flagellar M-ring protein n=1 Tax=Clostridium aestuarii TaxID=338193 RepID=A0ABT4CZZ5_9CLOT|nr:flagellar basal-body MS-ring/collar protein FliF [Clostridium aestuarii]MCY6483680.1 flagellar basal-body MS-ring/collar protein FliF [Clostridium aestuarii]
MDKIKQHIKKLAESFKGLSKGKKIAYSVLTVGVITSIIFLTVYLNATNYVVLFREMDPNDAQTVLAKLNEKKIQYTVKNNTIRVPEDKVAELRMDLVPQLTNGNRGYEILDEGSKFGMTDKERATKYKIAIEGELAKTIRTFPEVKQAKVQLVMQEESNFFRESEDATASVTLEVTPGKNIAKDQIKAIVSLVTGSVRNLPKENVKVIGIINGVTKELSENLFENEENVDLGTATTRQREYEKDLEKEYEKKIVSLLSSTYIKGVQVAVDVEVDFDAAEKTSVIWDKNPVVISEESKKDINTSSSEKENRSPIDDNMSNTYTDENGNVISSSHEEYKKNYEVGKIEEKVVSSPGKIKRIAASVIVNDKDLNEEEKDKIKNTIAAAISYDQSRGDIISIEGMKFNSGISEAAIEQEAKAAEEEENRKKMLMYKYIGAGAAALIMLLVILISLKKSKKVKKEEKIQGMDVVIDDNIQPKETLEPIDFEEDNERNHVENEIKRYASEKPEQVAEIIKSWMAEDER